MTEIHASTDGGSAGLRFLLAAAARKRRFIDELMGGAAEDRVRVIAAVEPTRAQEDYAEQLVERARRLKAVEGTRDSNVRNAARARGELLTALAAARQVSVEDHSPVAIALNQASVAASYMGTILSLLDFNAEQTGHLLLENQRLKGAGAPSAAMADAPTPERVAEQAEAEYMSGVVPADPYDHGWLCGVQEALAWVIDPEDQSEAMAALLDRLRRVDEQGD